MSSTEDSTAAGDSQLPASATSAESLSENLSKMNISSSATFSIWPPTQRTRDAVINRLIETLCSPSVLSKRYGSMPHDEASSAARAIEEEAYAAASAAAGDSGNASVDEGIEILQVYSKEISKRMLETVKSRNPNANANANVSGDENANSTSDEAPAGENESSA